MPLAQEQRKTLTRVLRWSRHNGWTRDAYPCSWRRPGDPNRVSFDSDHGVLSVVRTGPEPDPRRCVALVRINSLDVALNALAGLGLIPISLAPAYADPRMHAGLALPCDVCGPTCLLDDDGAGLDRHDPAAADEFDGPASFTEAGQAFADAVNGQVSAARAAEVLSALAQNGLIVSVGYHDEMIAEPAGGAVWPDDLAPVLPFGVRS